MPHEIALLDALVPSLFAVFLLSVASTLVLDRLFAGFGIYRLVWYPALFRLAIFVTLFCGLGLWIY